MTAPDLLVPYAPRILMNAHKIVVRTMVRAKTQRDHSVVHVLKAGKVQNVKRILMNVKQRHAKTRGHVKII